jgi:hypothetical protein
MRFTQKTEGLKTIIAGSRTITDLRIVEKAIEESGFKIAEVVCGGARGVDDLGRKWAGNGHRVPVKLFPDRWSQFGKSAGHRRNFEMCEYADALIAVWDGKSPWTKNIIEIARKKGLHVFVFHTDANLSPEPEDFSPGM